MSSEKKVKTSVNELLLENKMECLDLNESMGTPSPSSSKESPSLELPSKRILRRRSLPMATENRRVLTKPKKSLNSSSVENIYMCKQTVKRLPPNLETIFEEPKVTKNSDILYIGLRKQKRVILFGETVHNKGKVKKRQMKAKKVLGKSYNKKKRATMEALLEKLKYVE